MAEGKDQTDPPPVPTEGDDEDEVTPGYKTPKQVDLKTLQELDQDDESLVKYKQQLLGAASNVQDDGGPNVLLKKMIFAPVDHAPFDLDLTGDLTKFKDNPIIVKEGCQYRILIQFRVQREIVSGLRYAYSVHRKGIRVDKNNLMVGSYGPKTEPHEFKSPPEETPAGLIKRGTYVVKSRFTDDDKHIYLEWEWAFEIKKDWE